MEEETWIWFNFGQFSTTVINYRNYECHQNMYAAAVNLILYKRVSKHLTAPFSTELRYLAWHFHIIDSEYKRCIAHMQYLIQQNILLKLKYKRFSMCH